MNNQQYDAVLFDMDGTLTRSKSEIAPEVFYALVSLGRRVPVGIVSGATREQILAQIPHFEILPEAYVLAQNGNDTQDVSGKKIWRNELTAEEKGKIREHVVRISNMTGSVVDDATYEDRGCQISYSFVGHNAPINDKERFDPDRHKRKKILASAPFEASGLMATIGGTTCLDYTRGDCTKGENVRRLMREYGWQSVLYLGDALSEGGNDSTVIGVCQTREVSGPRETLSIIRELLGTPERVVAVSGYFNPVHKGHVNLFSEAKALGDKLIVILNNDEQVKQKGSVAFMSAEERAEVISSLRFVDEVVISIDKDRTVCRTLESVAPHIFANGGDRETAADIPETAVCERLNIEMVFNVGGGKVQSSSWLIEKAKISKVSKRVAT